MVHLLKIAKISVAELKLNLNLMLLSSLAVSLFSKKSYYLKLKINWVRTYKVDFIYEYLYTWQQEISQKKKTKTGFYFQDLPLTCFSITSGIWQLLRDSFSAISKDIGADDLQAHV